MLISLRQVPNYKIHTDSGEESTGILNHTLQETAPVRQQLESDCIPFNMCFGGGILHSMKRKKNRAAKGTSFS
jgi:hypothetical protein